MPGNGIYNFVSLNVLIKMKCVLSCSLMNDVCE